MRTPARQSRVGVEMGGVMSHRIPTRAEVVVVGAGVAGAATAILLAKLGMRVLLVDRRRDIDDYKGLCTHFVQPLANSVFKDMGLTRLLTPAYSIRTKASFRIPGGEIDLDGGYSNDPVTAYAHNLERRVLDPEMRREALALGVVFAPGVSVCAVERREGDFILTLASEEGTQQVVCRFLIAADGRNSVMARLLGVPATTLPNDRAAYFCHCSGIGAPSQNRSIFVLENQEMSFLYPLIGARTLLSVYVRKERWDRWGSGAEVFAPLLRQFASQLPYLDFSGARLESRVFGYKKYDNQVRPPVTNGVAFVGDASISVDPMSGVGCSFALKSARLLVDAVIAHFDDTNAATSVYAESHTAFFSAHVTGIAADSLLTKTEKSVADSFGVILRDKKLQERYLALTARLITPEAFQRSYLASVARAKSNRSRADDLVPMAR